MRGPRFSGDLILKVYDRASPWARAAGEQWYPEAHRLACQFEADSGRTGNIPGQVGAGVLAALSPMMPWPRNQLLAALAFSRGQASGSFGSAVRQANRILALEHPLDVLKGPKVRSFYRCILRPTDPFEVCIDRHAVAIAHRGQPVADGALDLVGVYDRCQEVYRQVAERLHVLPLTLQAVTWVQWRAEQGIHHETGARRGARK